MGLGPQALYWGGDKISTCPKAPGPRVTPTTKWPPDPWGMKDTALVKDGFFVTYIPELRSYRLPNLQFPEVEVMESGGGYSITLSLTPFPVYCPGMSVSTPLHLGQSGKTDAPKTPVPDAFLKTLNYGCHPSGTWLPCSKEHKPNGHMPCR